MRSSKAPHEATTRETAPGRLFRFVDDALLEPTLAQDVLSQNIPVRADAHLVDPADVRQRRNNIDVFAERSVRPIDVHLHILQGTSHVYHLLSSRVYRCAKHPFTVGSRLPGQGVHESVSDIFEFPAPHTPPVFHTSEGDDL